MFEQLGEAGRQAVQAAQLEARDLGDALVGTEHLLLGLLASPSSPVAAAFGDAGVTIAQVRAEIGGGPAGPSGARPFTPRLRRVLEQAARAGAGGSVGLDHLVAALVDDGGGLAVQLIRWFGIDLCVDPSPRCPGCGSDLARWTAYRRVIAAPEGVRTGPPLALLVAYCRGCGRALAPAG